MESSLHSEPSPQILWTRVLDRIRTRIPESAFNTWFPLLGIAECRRDRMVLGVPNTFVLEYVEHHYRAVLESAVAEAAGRAMSVAFAVTEAPALEIFHPGAEAGEG